MIPFKKQPQKIEQIGNKEIFIFDDLGDNIDMKTVESFGEEWTTFSQFSDEEIKTAGDQYFDIVNEIDLDYYVMNELKLGILNYAGLDDEVRLYSIEYKQCIQNGS